MRCIQFFNTRTSKKMRSLLCTKRRNTARQPKAKCAVQGRVSESQCHQEGAGTAVSKAREGRHPDEGTLALGLLKPLKFTLSREKGEYSRKQSW